MSVIIRDAQTAYSCLNGVFCIYKGRKMPYNSLMRLLKMRLAKDLNTLETRPCKEIVKIVGDVGVDRNFQIQRSLSLADHPLVVGERYQDKDIPINIYQNLGLYVSGVNLVGIGQEGFGMVNALRNVNLVKEYEIMARLGRATLDFTEQGKMIAESKYKFVTAHKIDMLCNKIVAANTRYALRAMGASMHSQAAYEFFSQGPLKPPRKDSDPILFAMRCVHFKPPYFKLRVSTVNENPLYFRHLINQIGLMLRTHACISSMMCTRMGKFTLDDALTYKQFDVQSVLQNMANNAEKTREHLENRSFTEHQNQNIKLTNSVQVDRELLDYKSPLKESPLE